MSTDSTQPEKATGDAPLSSDLTKFQLRCLAVIGAADRAPKGVAVLDALDDYYDEAQHHGRLYPNLDTLVAKGLVEKGTRDERTNEYWLTDRGRRVLRAETDWFVEHARAAGLDEDEPEIVTDGGQHQCVRCGHAYDRTQHEECPRCSNDTLDPITDGGLPQHLTPTSTIDGGTIYRCTRCGCEGARVVSHLDGCPAFDGEERVQAIATDGGVETIDPEIEAEYVGAHSALVATACQGWPDGAPDAEAFEPEQCGAKATHTVVMFDGRLHEVGMCDDCGEPADVRADDRAWSGQYVGEDADDPEIVTDGGVVQTDHVERARDLLAAARDRLDGLGGAEIVAIDERLAAADEELAAHQEGSQ
jgi:hypothetical protein